MGGGVGDVIVVGLMVVEVEGCSDREKKKWNEAIWSNCFRHQPPFPCPLSNRINTPKPPLNSLLAPSPFPSSNAPFPAALKIEFNCNTKNVSSEYHYQIVIAKAESFSLKNASFILSVLFLHFINMILKICQFPLLEL